MKNKKEGELKISDGSELLRAGSHASSLKIPMETANICLHLKDTSGKDCEIDMLELLRALRSLAPELMDKLWEKARKE